MPVTTKQIDNPNGKYRCRDCGTPLQPVVEYTSPKGRNTTLFGYCTKENCSHYGAKQPVK
jgi:hypothetical protein